MSDETENQETPAAEEQAEEATSAQAEVSPLARPLPVYVVTATRLEHDGETYLAGETFSHPDERVIAALRKAEAITLPEALADADTLAAEAAAKDAEIAALRAELERLHRAANAKKSGK